MLSFAVRKLAGVAGVMFGATVIVSLLLNFVPGDPVLAMLGEQALPANIEALRSELWLDLPLWEQYGRFVAGFFAGTLPSLGSRTATVPELIGARLPSTMLLAALAMLLAVAISVPLGTVAALRKYSAIDNVAMLAALSGAATPRFWLGPVLILIFAIELRWLPVSGNTAGAASYVMPVVTLATALMAMLSRMTRGAVAEALTEDFVRTARAKGLPERVVVVKHALRNALMPVITVAGLQFGSLLAGAIVTEKVFNWPGLGTLLVDAITARDIRLVQGCVLTISLVYVVVNTLTDLCYAVVDPRIRNA